MAGTRLLIHAIFTVEFVALIVTALLVCYFDIDNPRRIADDVHHDQVFIDRRGLRRHLLPSFPSRVSSSALVVPPIRVRIVTGKWADDEAVVSSATYKELEKRLSTIGISLQLERETASNPCDEENVDVHSSSPPKDDHPLTVLTNCETTSVRITPSGHVVIRLAPADDNRPNILNPYLFVPPPTTSPPKHLKTTPALDVLITLIDEIPPDNNTAAITRTDCLGRALSRGVASLAPFFRDMALLAPVATTSSRVTVLGTLANYAKRRRRTDGDGTGDVYYTVPVDRITEQLFEEYAAGRFSPLTTTRRRANRFEFLLYSPRRVKSPLFAGEYGGSG
eukprot:CAMPEP_0172487034 /NCGR_PEP_ID=MMETSP1066-20121228/15872_1 /TAXON_ID=671091 /ORGANISM="Coscinodiscus wailesii, Strain CCMP2513" /LENGTH=335 /DNA_ID=CAMNT_0013253373 /DNA_START=36 /DNA_END=1039 /DNA_ORIENTATION=-